MVQLSYTHLQKSQTSFSNICSKIIMIKEKRLFLLQILHYWWWCPPLFIILVTTARCDAGHTPAPAPHSSVLHSPGQSQLLLQGKLITSSTLLIFNSKSEWTKGFLKFSKVKIISWKGFYIWSQKLAWSELLQPYAGSKGPNFEEWSSRNSPSSWG